MIQRVKQEIRKCLRSLYERIAFQHYDPRRYAVRELCVPASAISCFSLSSNNIKFVQTSKGGAYFREIICRSPLPEYMRYLVEDYLMLLRNERVFDNFAQEAPIEISFTEDTRLAFAAYVRVCSCRPGFYRKLGDLFDIVTREGYSMWNPASRLTPEMLAEFGFSDCPADAMRVFPDFVAFIGNGIKQYRRSALAGAGGMDSFNACRCVATKVVADALGLGRLIPETEVVLLSVGERKMYGVLSSCCPGKRAKDALWRPSPTLQRNLADLQLLDVLCYQSDHWVNNYNVSEHEGRASGVMAFDNDNLWTFGPFPGISFISTYGGDPILASDGLLRLPHLSSETAQRILKCDAAALIRTLKPYLNGLQCWALRCRLRALQRAIRRTAKARQDFLLDDDAWNEVYLQLECSGAFGRTYTYLYATTRDSCDAELQA